MSRSFGSISGTRNVKHGVPEVAKIIQTFASECERSHVVYRGVFLLQFRVATKRLIEQRNYQLSSGCLAM